MVSLKYKETKALAMKQQLEKQQQGNNQYTNYNKLLNKLK